jgi:TRAP-type C4-dicarboxylate transport system permease small subunit
MINTLFKKVLNAIASLGSISSFLLVVMVLIVVINVVGRFFFKFPMFGTIELVELTMTVICFFAIPYTSVFRRHVRITLIIDHLSESIRRQLERVVSILNAAIFSLIAYQAIKNAMYYARNLAQCTDTLEIPIAPFKGVMAIGFVLLLVVEIIAVFRPAPPDQEGLKR